MKIERNRALLCTAAVLAIACVLGARGVGAWDDMETEMVASGGITTVVVAQAPADLTSIGSASTMERTTLVEAAGSSSPLGTSELVVSDAALARARIAALMPDVSAQSRVSGPLRFVVSMGDRLTSTAVAILLSQPASGASITELVLAQRMLQAAGHDISLRELLAMQRRSAGLVALQSRLAVFRARLEGDQIGSGRTVTTTSATTVTQTVAGEGTGTTSTQDVATQEGAATVEGGTTVQTEAGVDQESNVSCDRVASKAKTAHVKSERRTLKLAERETRRLEKASSKASRIERKTLARQERAGARSERLAGRCETRASMKTAVRGGRSFATALGRTGGLSNAQLHGGRALGASLSLGGGRALGANLSGGLRGSTLRGRALGLGRH